MASNYSGYQSPQYLSGYVSPDFGLIQNNLAQKQQKYDATMGAYAGQMAKLNEENAYDQGALQKLKDNFRQGFEDFYVNNRGDMASASGEAMRFLGDAKSDPGWNLLKLHDKAKAEEAVAMQRASAMGANPLMFKTVPDSILNGDYYRDPSEFVSDISPELDRMKKMEENWNNALFEKGTTTTERLNKAKGVWETISSGGDIRPEDVDTKLPLVWNEFKSSDEYNQQHRKMKEIAQYSINPKTGETYTSEDIDNMLKGELRSIGMKRVHTGNYSYTIQPYTAPHSGGSGYDPWNQGSIYNKVGDEPIASQVLGKATVSDVLGAKQGDDNYGLYNAVLNTAATTRQVTHYAGLVTGKLKSIVDMFVRPGDVTTFKKYPEIVKALANKYFSVDQLKSELEDLRNEKADEIISIKDASGKNTGRELYRKATQILDQFTKGSARSSINEITLGNYNTVLQDEVSKALNDSKSSKVTFVQPKIINVPEEVAKANDFIIKQTSQQFKSAGSGTFSNLFLDVITGEPLQGEPQEILGVTANDMVGVLARASIRVPDSDGKGYHEETHVYRVDMSNSATQSLFEGYDSAMGNQLTKSASARYIPTLGSNVLKDKGTEGEEVNLVNDLKVGVNKDGLYYLYTGDKDKGQRIKIVDAFDRMPDEINNEQDQLIGGKLQIVKQWALQQTDRYGNPISIDWANITGDGLRQLYDAYKMTIPDEEWTGSSSLDLEAFIEHPTKITGKYTYKPKRKTNTSPSVPFSSTHR